MRVAGEHHERYDGSGYPRKLAGEEISWPARWRRSSTSTTRSRPDRVYHKGMSRPPRSKRSSSGAGSTSREELARKFVQTNGIYPVGSFVRLENGLLGIVVAQGPKGPSLSARPGGLRHKEGEVHPPRDVGLSPGSGRSGGANRRIRIPARWNIEPQRFLEAGESVNRESKKPSRTPIHPFTHSPIHSSTTERRNSEPPAWTDGCPPNTRPMDGEDVKAVRRREGERRGRAGDPRDGQGVSGGGRPSTWGAGTSGRLGVLMRRSVRRPFPYPHTMVQGIMAGVSRGSRPVEGGSGGQARRRRPRDRPEESRLERHAVPGITAIGLTPFVAGAPRRGEEAWRRRLAPDLQPRSEEAALRGWDHPFRHRSGSPHRLHPPQGWDGDEARPEPDHDDLDDPPRRSTGT